MKVLIIAEAGVNHNGDIALAEKLIDAASDAGADYVKFQTFKADKLVSKDAKKADYQNKNTGDANISQYDMLKKLELSEAHHHHLKSYATSRSIKFLSTAFDLDSINFLNTLGIDLFKIPSGEITNYPYLVQIAKCKKPVILSTGMADMQEIKDAIAVLLTNGVERKDITVLHCNTEYPTPYRDVNLKAMLSIHQTLNVQYGYSDHTLGIEVPIAAVALGACVIEKHFTLDKSLPGPDHLASLEPSALKEMIQGIRNIEQAIQGDGVKIPSPSETKNKVIARKSIFTSKFMQAGQIIQADDLIMMRPGDGISPMEIMKIIGKRVNQDINSGEKLSWQHFQ